MRKLYVLSTCVAVSLMVQTVGAYAAYNFGDYRSETLTTKAWNALKEGDLEAVLVYTNKCVEMYADQAKKMQSSLTGYPTGSNDQIFSYWALNDIATSLFIQGESYRKANKTDEAKTAYNRVVNEFSFGQAWDPQGWFWKPAEAARDKLSMLESGSTMDFGDYTSSFLTSQAWKALAAGKQDEVSAYVDKVLELYSAKARQMQDSLTEYPWESKDKIFEYWALNDVGTSLYIQGEALRKAGKNEEAQKAYQKLVDQYFYAQCWDPKGWFWKPAEAAQQALDELGST
ncbi:MAG: tetratricopeptide repeat protein [Candidatus Omnitrophica bacterium]|nr:tetratricopeptide repeat protein [Candidatus Omnitrophota bacterium]